MAILWALTTLRWLVMVSDLACSTVGKEDSSQTLPIPLCFASQELISGCQYWQGTPDLRRRGRATHCPKVEPLFHTIRVFSESLQKDLLGVSPSGALSCAANSQQPHASLSSALAPGIPELQVPEVQSCSNGN